MTREAHWMQSFLPLWRKEKLLTFLPLHNGSASSMGSSPISSLVTIDFYYYKVHTFLIVVRKMP